MGARPRNWESLWRTAAENLLELPAALVGIATVAMLAFQLAGILLMPVAYLLEMFGIRLPTRASIIGLAVVAAVGTVGYFARAMWKAFGGNGRAPGPLGPFGR